MDSELTRPSEGGESQSSKLSSVNPSDLEAGSNALDTGVASSDDSDSDSDSDDDGSGAATPATQVEWLATGRQRRATAGNRMKAMLANEEPDSDLELLFAEDENDQGFSDAGDNASDVQMDSSSDEDGGQPDDELEGEKELDRQAKERRAAQRKRKAQEAIPAKFRKKVRIDTSNSTPRSSSAATPQPQARPQQQPRPKKKSERASWLPAVSDMPTRASSRQTTRHSKEQLHAQMEEREAKRLKQLAQMQKKAARLEALKKPPMTQEDRLREAAIVEERNSKSLNRWEEAEKLREEERRAKLAALHERTLNGPVISFWSGMGRFGDGWVKGEGIHVAVEEKPKKQRKEKPAKGKKKDEAKEGVEVAVANGAPGDGKATDAAAVKAEPTADAQAPAATEASAPIKEGEAKTDAPKEGATETTNGAATTESKDTPMNDAPDAQTNETTIEKADAATTETTDATKDTAKDVSMTDAPEAGKDAAKDATEPKETTNGESQPAEAKKAGGDLPNGTHTAEEAAATTGAKTGEAKEVEAPAETATADASAEPKTATEKDQTAPTEKPAAATTNGNATDAEASKQTPLQPIENDSLPASKVVSQLQSEAATPQPEQARSPMDGLATTRNAIIYQNFDENAIKDRTIQKQVLFGRKMSRLPSKYTSTRRVYIHAERTYTQNAY